MSGVSGGYNCPSKLGHTTGSGTEYRRSIALFSPKLNPVRGPVGSPTGAATSTPKGFHIVQTKLSAYIDVSSAVRNLLAMLLTTLLWPTLGWGAPFVYVSTAGGTVSVVDVASNSVISTSAVSNNPSSFATNPAGTRVYVANVFNNTVSVIDVASNVVIATVPVGGLSPTTLVVNPAGTRLYVADQDNLVSVIDTASNSVIATVRANTFGGMTVSPDGARVYVTGSQFMSVIDTASNTVIAKVTVGNFASGVVLNQAGTRAYVVSVDTVSVIDTARNAIIATVPVSSAAAIAINPSGAYLYVTDSFQRVNIIDTATNTVVNRVGVNWPRQVKVSLDGVRLYVVSGYSLDTVNVIDIASNTVISTFKPVPKPTVATSPTPTPTPTPPIPSLSSTPTLSGVGSSSALNLNAGKGPEMTACLMNTVRALFGADAQYLGQNVYGVATVSQGGRIFAFIPVQAGTDNTMSADVHLGTSNSLNIGTSCGNLDIAPGIGNLTEFAAVMTRMGLRATVGAKGVITVDVGTTRYVARPDYVVTTGAPGAAGLAYGSDGLYRFTDSVGNVQILRPAFYDTDSLVAQVPQILRQGGNTFIQSDGTAVFTTTTGQAYVLTPDLTVNDPEPTYGSSMWWQDATNHYVFRSNTVKPQGFTVRAR